MQLPKKKKRPNGRTPIGVVRTAPAAKRIIDRLKIVEKAPAEKATRKLALLRINVAARATTSPTIFPASGASKVLKRYVINMLANSPLNDEKFADASEAVFIWLRNNAVKGSLRTILKNTPRASNATAKSDMTKFLPNTTEVIMFMNEINKSPQNPATKGIPTAYNRNRFMLSLN